MIAINRRFNASQNLCLTHYPLRKGETTSESPRILLMNLPFNTISFMWYDFCLIGPIKKLNLIMPVHERLWATWQTC